MFRTRPQEFRNRRPFAGVKTPEKPAPARTILDDLRDVVAPGDYDRSFDQLLEMHRDARLMLAVYQCVGFNHLVDEFCGYDPIVLRVFHSHFHAHTV